MRRRTIHTVILCAALLAVLPARQAQGQFDLETKITASDAAGVDLFGVSVALAGDTTLVGANGNDDDGDNSGSAYIFDRNQGGPDNWGQVLKLTASDAAASDRFGISVALAGGTALVGAFRNDDDGDNSGSAYVFARNQGGADNWGEVIKLTASDAAAGDEFGGSVALAGDTALVGAFFHDDAANNAGSAYIFVPEPATLTLLALGGLTLLRRRRGPTPMP